MRIPAGKKLQLVQLAVYSAGDTITREQALAFISSLFAEDPGTRINAEMFAELLNLVTPSRPRRLRKKS
jgi:hypothetical protein